MPSSRIYETCGNISALGSHVIERPFQEKWDRLAGRQTKMKKSEEEGVFVFYAGRRYRPSLLVKQAQGVRKIGVKWSDGWRVGKIGRTIVASPFENGRQDRS